MDKLRQKHTQLLQALKTLKTAIDRIKKLEAEKEKLCKTIDYEEEYRTHRDSVIQRFEYSIDLFWKYIKKYLEEKHMFPAIKSPAEVIRQACAAKIIDEAESETILEMIKSRNI